MNDAWFRRFKVLQRGFGKITLQLGKIGIKIKLFYPLIQFYFSFTNR
jgi:hypothetical protein